MLGAVFAGRSDGARCDRCRGFGGRGSGRRGAWRRGRSIVRLSLAFCLLGSGIANGAESEAERFRARARRHWSRGAYDRASVAFEKAYLVSGRPVYLWWMAECARHTEQPDRAAHLYRRYLRDAPRGRFRRQARAHLAAPTARARASSPGATTPETKRRAGRRAGPKRGRAKRNAANGDADRSLPKAASAPPQKRAASGALLAAASPALRLSPRPAEGPSTSAALSLGSESGPAQRASAAVGTDGTPLYERWWFWAGIGAVAAGTAATWLSFRGGSTPGPAPSSGLIVDFRGAR